MVTRTFSQDAEAPTLDVFVTTAEWFRGRYEEQSSPSTQLHTHPLVWCTRNNKAPIATPARHRTAGTTEEFVSNQCNCVATYRRPHQPPAVAYLKLAVRICDTSATIFSSPASPDIDGMNPSLLVGILIPARSTSENHPLTKHDATVLAIRQECFNARKRRDRGEITHAEFMQIARDCIQRFKAQEAASSLLCDQVDRGKISLEEWERECGYSAKDWKKLQPDVERDLQSASMNMGRNRVRVVQNRGSRGH
ncbi:hypothetical protein EVG20_g6479 [Dentipellis fragilis]|uniref:Uncharacterized protein n=1 Tax=Dentipellis fragilis TaxID=205917 RepID=A0A4Y9YLP1_9AGAM|nr:hypothetical protein EVG20_g6479 [Dentipellis fragilis]